MNTTTSRTTTIAQLRGWTGPALFSYGFRPFFLFGALHAALMLALWVPWYLGLIALPSAFPPVAWHTHELLFGYVPAIVAGFLLTAVPNWTGRLPVVGRRLGVLFAFWVLGRVVVAASLGLPPLLVAALSLAFLLGLGVVIGREIVAGRNWRNLKVLAGVIALSLAQALFHYEVWRHGRATYGDHLAVAATLMLIMIVGGRIVPSFTTNWLKRENPGPQPAPFDLFDKASMGVATIALACWIMAPAWPAAAPGFGALLLIAGALQAIRLIRWQGHRTLAEPLVTVLHIGFAFVPLGFALAGFALMTGADAVATGATHAWTVGAIGLMTLAMMTRSTRGHTGHSLNAPPSTMAIYALMLIAVMARLVAVYLPNLTPPALGMAAIAWVGAFALFIALYGPMLLRKKSK